MTSIIEVYNQFISMLMNDPRLAQSVFVNSTFLQGDYRRILEIVLDLIKRHGEVTYYDWQANGLNADDYFSLSEAYIVLDCKTFERYQTIIIEDYKQRKALELTHELKNKTLGFDEYFRKISAINEIKTAEIKYLTASEMENTLTNPKINIKFMHYPKFRILTNIKQNDFIVIAAGTGKGKSAFALNLMSDLSINYPCMYLNMEMAKDEALFRIMASNTSIPISKLEKYSFDKNALTEQEVEEVRLFAEKFESRKVQFMNNSLTLDQLKALVSSHDQKEHFIVFVDHMGLIGCKGNAYERMTAIAKELRKLSLDYNCTIFALCQLSRNGQQGNKEPELSDLRDSGEIEQSASRVVFLHELSDNNYKVIVAKNRGGRKGNYFAEYHKSIQEFKEVERKHA